jgi:Tfp pilus assembly protein PilV
MARTDDGLSCNPYKQGLQTTLKVSGSQHVFQKSLLSRRCGEFGQRSLFFAILTTAPLAHNKGHSNLDRKDRKLRFSTFKKPYGLTFAELMISFALLAVVIVVVIGLFVKLLNASTKGLDQTVALDIAQNRLDVVAASPASKWAGFAKTVDMAIVDSRSNTTFYYNLTWDELSKDGIKIDNKMGDLYRVDVEVFWWPDDANNPKASQRIEAGKLRVNLSRIVYIENMKQ